MNPQQPDQPVSYNSSGRSGKSIMSTAILIILLIAALAFGGWSFSKMQDYKNNSDKKAAVAVEAAKKLQATQLQAQFNEQNKSPYKVFHGLPTYGSISFNYPKTWSTYVDATNTNEPINVYFNPDEVPGVQSKTAFGLRVELVSTDYSQLLQQFNSQVTQGTLTARAYVPPKMQGVANVVAGTYFNGQINNQDPTQKGNMVVIKVRDKTLQIYTETDQFSSDFNNTVL